MKKTLITALVLSILLPSMSLEASPLAVDNFTLEAPQKSLEYLSPVLQSPNEFTGLIAEYNLEMSEDDSAEIYFRFQDVDLVKDWSEWVMLEAGHSDSHHEDEPQSALINTNKSQNFQFRIDIKSGPDKYMPSLSDLDFEFIDTDNWFDAALNTKNKLASLTSDASDSNLTIISRQAWGSNEDLLFYGETYEPEDDTEEELSEEEEEFWEEYWEEIARVSPKDGDRYYKWPLEYMKKVRTIVIHHTASVNDLDDPKKAIRNIQYYHAVKRGWGDIGYNYVIDPKGIIYEGRRGGEMVVGGHAVPVNRTSIGISVMGNFQTQAVPKEVVEAIVKLSRVKAELYDLDLNAETEYKEEIYDVLQGHRDNSPTACPGENLYAALPSIRYLAMKGNGDTIDILRGQDLAYINAEPLKNIIEMEAFETDTIQIKLINVGTETWSKANTYLDLSTLDKIKYDKAVRIEAKASLSEDSVAPGETGTFNLKLESLLKPGYHGLEMSVTLNSEKQVDSPLFIPIYLREADLSYDIIKNGASSTVNLDPKEEKTLNFTLENTGDVAWNRDDIKLILATENGSASSLAKSRSSVLMDLDADRIEPGEELDFQLKLKAPSVAGTYSEIYSPKIEGVAWLKGESIELTVKVKGEAPKTEEKQSVAVSAFLIEKTNSQVKIPIKELATLALEIENNSGVTWQKSDLQIDLETGEKGMGPNKFSEFRLAEAELKDGENGHIIFKVYPRNYGAFNYNLVVEGEKQRFKILAAESKDETEELTEEEVIITEDLGPRVRVLLSFFSEDSAEVSSYKDGLKFEVKLDERLLGESESISLEQVEDKVLIDLNGKTYQGEVLSLIGASNGVLEIENYEHRPSWNESLNDNKFRGNLEFRVVDGALVTINELSLEHYLYGLAEISNSALSEKIKTIVVAARSYAYHYVSKGTKFPGKPWDLDDDPDHSQKYLGYGFELRAPKVTEAADDTRGKVVVYEEEAIKVPYFTQSDGMTKSAEEVWGWTSTPYLIAVEDTFCDATETLGHGVGISGCGASGMAENGLDHEEIIKYFLQGVNFKYVYFRD